MSIDLALHSRLRRSRRTSQESFSVSIDLALHSRLRRYSFIALHLIRSVNRPRSSQSAAACHVPAPPPIDTVSIDLALHSRLRHLKTQNKSGLHLCQSTSLFTVGCGRQRRKTDAVRLTGAKSANLNGCRRFTLQQPSGAENAVFSCVRILGTQPIRHPPLPVRQYIFSSQL